MTVFSIISTFILTFYFVYDYERLLKLFLSIFPYREKANSVGQSKYHEVIDSVATEYEKGMKASKKEINDLAKDLKKHWKTISNSPKNLKRDLLKMMV
ncbi:MAG: hypothetical protein WCP15_04075 [bacterium]